jgi:hypothetical protein
MRTTITLNPKKSSSIRRSDLSTVKLATDLRAGRTHSNRPFSSVPEFVEVKGLEPSAYGLQSRRSSS